jgi:hypothetical protein
VAPSHSESPSPRPEKLFDVLLRRTFYLCGILFLAVGCWLGWRVVVLTQRVEAQLEAMEARLEAIDEKVASVGEGLAAARARTASVLQLDDLAVLLAAMREAREEPELDEGTPPEVEKEIDALLAAVRAHEGDFLCDGEPCSPFSLHARLYTKRLVHGDRIGTAEQFIDRIAAYSMSGLPYEVPGEGDAEPERLSDWLLDRLEEHRSLRGGP